MEIAGAVRRFISHKSRLRNEFRLVAGEIRIQTEKKKLEAPRQTHSHFQTSTVFLFTSTEVKASSTGLKNERPVSIFPPGL